MPKFPPEHRLNFIAATSDTTALTNQAEKPLSAEAQSAEHLLHDHAMQRCQPLDPAAQMKFAGAVHLGHQHGRAKQHIDTDKEQQNLWRDTNTQIGELQFTRTACHSKIDGNQNEYPNPRGHNRPGKSDSVKR